MKACKHPGKCALCGKYKELTFEHVPPKNAYNSTPILQYSFDEVMKTISAQGERMPWEFEGLKGKVQQKGSGGYYICRECNNDTGSWYIRAYTDFANTIGSALQINKVPNRSHCFFMIYNCFPLRLFKAILTMFCDINPGLS